MTAPFHLLSDHQIHDELCERLRAARLEINITQAELAERAVEAEIAFRNDMSNAFRITKVLVVLDGTAMAAAATIPQMLLPPATSLMANAPSPKKTYWASEICPEYPVRSTSDRINVA